MTFLRKTPLIATVSVAAFLSIAASGTTLTGSGSVMTGSGSMMSSSSDAFSSARVVRTKDFHTKILQGSKDEAAIRERLATFLKKQADLRRACRDDLRRSNKDTRMNVMMRCYKGDLGLESEYLQKLSAQLATMAGLTQSVRQTAQNRVELLHDAMDTVILAIDAGVYRTQEDLTEARANLLLKYRTPYWAALTDVRADRALSWTGYFVTLLDEMSAGQTEEPTAEWTAARTCLLQTEKSLAAVLELSKDKIAALRPALASLQTCVTTLQTLSMPATQSGSTIIR